MCARGTLQTSADLLQLRQSAAAVDHYSRAPAALSFGSGDSVLQRRAARAIWLDSASGGRRVGDRVQPHRLRRSAPPRAELAKAERFFRDSLAHRPEHLEARVRHGRVLDHLGRHEEASANCAGPLPDGASDQLLYLAQLFLGRAEEALEHGEAARAAFERASALYPNAQSPRLALSQIARRAGNRPAAQRELQPFPRCLMTNGGGRIHGGSTTTSADCLVDDRLRLRASRRSHLRCARVGGQGRLRARRSGA